MRRTTRALVKHYVEGLDLRGDVLEVGAHRLSKSAIDLFPADRFDYHDLNLARTDLPQTIVGDITNCRDVIDDGSYDIVFSSDVFEHIDRPWLAAEEIARILRPDGIVIVQTLWAWRNHPCPIDYWRFSPQCLEFLFSDLTTLESGYDLSQRRMDHAGAWTSGQDSVPVDELGGWREHWSVYIVARKGGSVALRPFKDTQHPLARPLRADTQGRVTSPAVLAKSGMQAGRSSRWRTTAARRLRQLADLIS